MADARPLPEKGDRIILSTPRGNHGMTVLESGGEVEGLHLPQAALYSSPDSPTHVRDSRCTDAVPNGPIPGAAIPHASAQRSQTMSPLPPLLRPTGSCVSLAQNGQVIRRQHSLGASASSATLPVRKPPKGPAATGNQASYGQGGLTSSASAACFGQGRRPGSARHGENSSSARSSGCVSLSPAGSLAASDSVSPEPARSSQYCSAAASASRNSAANSAANGAANGAATASAHQTPPGLAPGGTPGEEAASRRGRRLDLQVVMLDPDPVGSSNPYPCAYPQPQPPNPKTQP